MSDIDAGRPRPRDLRTIRATLTPFEDRVVPRQVVELGGCGGAHSFPTGTSV